jgi:hypothetical protein
MRVFQSGADDPTFQKWIRNFSVCTRQSGETIKRTDTLAILFRLLTNTHDTGNIMVVDGCTFAVRVLDFGPNLINRRTQVDVEIINVELATAETVTVMRQTV